MTPFQQFTEKWQGCTACYLHETRRKVVLMRGTVPCDILFCGEAPGESEDAVGLCFIGPAGKLLDNIVQRSVPEGLTTCYCNLCCCIPRTQDGGKAGEPPPEAIMACGPRLEEFVKLARPRLIVCVGQLASAWIIGTKGRRHLLKGYGGALAEIAHPAYMLRAPGAQRGLLEQRAVVAIKRAVEETFGEQ